MFYQNKKFILYAGIIIAILAVIIIALAIYNRLPVDLQITSTQTPIDVYIDNTHYTTPTVVNLRPGTYTIWGAKIGYLTYKQTFKLSRTNNNLQINLETDPQAGYPPEGAPN